MRTKLGTSVLLCQLTGFGLLAQPPQNNDPHVYFTSADDFSVLDAIDSVVIFGTARQTVTFLHASGVGAQHRLDTTVFICDQRSADVLQSFITFLVRIEGRFGQRSDLCPSLEDS